MSKSVPLRFFLFSTRWIASRVFPMLMPMPISVSASCCAVISLRIVPLSFTLIVLPLERVTVCSSPIFDLSFHFIRKLISSAPRILVSTVFLSSSADTFWLSARAKIPLDGTTRAKDIRPAKIFFCNPRLIKLPPYYCFCILLTNNQMDTCKFIIQKRQKL